MSTRKLQQSRMYIHGGMRQHHEILVPHGTILDDLIRPEFWSHVAKQLRSRDKIEVIAEDNSFLASLYVMDVTDNAASVVIISSQKLDELRVMASPEEIELDEEQYDVEFTASEKWRAVRKADRKVVVSGYADRRQAEYALSELLQRLASAA